MMDTGYSVLPDEDDDVPDTPKRIVIDADNVCVATFT